MKLPTTVGLELEFNGLTTNLKALRLDLVTAKLDGWRIKSDASCGYELVSPVLKTFEDLESVKTAVDVLSSHGAKIDQRCGLHVHLGSQSLTKAQLYRLVSLMLRHQAGFFRLAEKTRQDNVYCRAASPEFMKRARYCWLYDAPVSLIWSGSRGNLESDRYLWLNGVSLTSYGTLEVRLMSSTVDHDTIRGWIELLLQVVSTAIHSTGDSFHFVSQGEKSFKQLLSMLTATCRWKGTQTTSVRRWAMRRYNQLTSDHNGERRELQLT